MLRARPKRRSLNKPEEEEPVSSKRKKTTKEDEFEDEDEEDDEFSPMDNTDEDSDYNPTKEKTKSSSSEEEDGEEGESKFFKPNSSGARKKPPWYMAKPSTSTNFKSAASFKSPSNFKPGTSTNFKSPASFKSPAQKQRTLLDSDSSSDEFERVPDSLDDLGGFQRLNKDVKSEDSDGEMENDGKEVEYFDFSQIIQNQEVLKAAAIKKERDGGGLGGYKRVKLPSSGRKKVKNSGGDDNDDVMKLLAMGEGAEIAGGMKKKKKQSSSEDEDDEYEETNRVERNSKGVEVTIAFPSQRKKEKKSCDVEAALKRRFNLVKKENQVFAHKVHLLCWIAHGNYLNSVLNCEDLMGVALSIIPSNYCYPPKRCDLTYLENFVKWFREKIKIDPVLGKDNLRPGKIVTSQSLQVQFNKKMADSRLDQLMLFIATLRALGLMVRLVINLRPVPLKPPVKELFTFKSPQEPVISSKGSDGGGKSNMKYGDSKTGGGKSEKDTDKVKREGEGDGKSKKDADKSKKEERENKVKKEVNVEKMGEEDGKSKKNADNLKKKREEEGENTVKKEIKEEEGVTSVKQNTKKDGDTVSRTEKSKKISKGKKEKVQEIEEKEEEEEEEEEKEGEISVKKITKRDSDAGSKNSDPRKVTQGKKEEEVEEIEEEDEEEDEEDVKETTVEKVGKSGENSSNAKKTTRKSAMKVEILDSDEENENDEASGEKNKIDDVKKVGSGDNLEKANEKDEPSVKKVTRKSLKKDTREEGSEKEIAAKNMKKKDGELKENGRSSSPESSPEIIRRTSKRNLNNTNVAKKEESSSSGVNKRSSKRNVKKGGKDVKTKESEDKNLVKDLKTNESEDKNQVNDLNTKEIDDKNQVKDLKTKECEDKNQVKDLKSKGSEENQEDKPQVKAKQGRTRSKTAAKSNLDEDIVEEFVCCNSRQRANIVDKSEISRVSRSSTKLAGKDVVTPKPKNFPDEDVVEKTGRGRSVLKKDDDNTPKSKEVAGEKKDGGRSESKKTGDKNGGRRSRSESLAGKNVGDKAEEVGKEKKTDKRGGKVKEKVEEEGVGKEKKATKRGDKLEEKVDEDMEKEKKATKRGDKLKEKVEEEEVEKEKKIGKKSVGSSSKYFENKEEPKTNGLKEEGRGRGKRQSKKLVEDLKESSDEDEEEEKKKKRRSSVGGKKKKNEKKIESDEEFEMESSYFKSKSSKIDRRVLSSDDEAKNEADKKMRKKNATDEWAEVFLEAEEKWICVDLTKGLIHCVQQLYSSASQPVTHVLGWENGRFIKDVTRRYVPHFMTVTRKQRGGVDGEEWWRGALRPFAPPRNARNREEDEDLDRQMEDQPLPTSISEYKNHPLYALQRHLLKFQAIYPPDAPTLGFIRNEPVYSRACVAELHCRESWIKFAKVVRAGEEPYKVVKARPKFDKMTGEFRSDLPLPLFGPWQVDDYVPPPAKDGKVPRNEYGNVELFQPSMLPAGTVHLKLPGLNRVARKLQIDCAQAVVGWDFHGGSSHVVMDGFVVCEEFEETLTEAWHQEQQEAEKRAREKMEQKVYGNWKRLIKGLLIREKLKLKYGFEIEDEVVAGTSGKGHKNKKTAKK